MFTTILITYFIMNNSAVAEGLLENYQVLSFLSFMISSGAALALVSSKALRYHSPTNFILLGIFTVMQSLMVGVFSTLVSPKAVCLGTMHTLTAFLAVTLYSFQPKPQYDLSVMGSALLTTLTALIVGSIFGVFLNLPWFDNFMSGALAVLFTTYLVHDTQQIVGGKHHKYQYGQKEYILAALNLYQDVVSMFIEIVKILHLNEPGKQKEKSEKEEW